MEKLKSIGSVMITLGVASFLLSLVNLQFKLLGFLGEYKVYVEIGSIIVGLILFGIAQLLSKKTTEEEN